MDEGCAFDPDWSVDAVLMARRVASKSKPRPVRHRQIQKAKGWRWGLRSKQSLNRYLDDLLEHGRLVYRRPEMEVDVRG